MSLNSTYESKKIAYLGNELHKCSSAQEMLVLTEHHLYILQTLLKKSNIIDATDSLYLKTVSEWIYLSVVEKRTLTSTYFPSYVYL